MTPPDRLDGRQAEIHAARDRKLEEARRQRKCVGSKVPQRILDCSSAKELLHSAVCASLLRGLGCSL